MFNPESVGPYFKMTDLSPSAPNTSSLGQRLLIVGNSCAGKSTLGAQLASVLDVPFVELDALNWEPNWVGLNDTDPDGLMRRMQKATEGDLAPTDGLAQRRIPAVVDCHPIPA